MPQVPAQSLAYGVVAQGAVLLRQVACCQVFPAVVATSASISAVLAAVVPPETCPKEVSALEMSLLVEPSVIYILSVANVCVPSAVE